MEIWKDIAGYEDLYQVSNLGRIKAKRTGRLLSQSDCRGYKHVALCRNGTMRTFQVHRLVAIAFIEKENGKNYVDHINTIKDDNRVENLRWCTEKENNNNPITRVNRSESKRGNKNPNYGKDLTIIITELAKINSKPVTQYNTEGEALKTYQNAQSASRSTGITASNINRACNGKRKSAGGYVWKFADAPL